MSVSLNDIDNLIKNFYIFGIEPEDINVSELEKNYDQKDILHIKLLSKFPPIESENYQIIDPNIIISHCFPNGVSLKISDTPIKDYEYFYFNLKNFYRISSSEKILYFACCIFYESIKDYINIKNIQKNTKESISKQNIYIPKLICINSFYQFPEQFKTILEKIISYSKSREINIPIEKIIENIVLGIPAPKKIIFYPEILNNVFKDKISFKLSDDNQVRSYSYKMQMIYNFKLEDILEIYKWIILEQPVLFFSEDKEKLTNIYETFFNLLFPFIYQGKHCSILPDCNSGIIEQEEYFVFGINEKLEYNEAENTINYFERLNMNIFKIILICDIDNKRIIPYKKYSNINTTYNDSNKNNIFSIAIICPQENNSNFLSKGEKCKLPQKYSDKLKNKLKDNFKKFSSKSDYSEEINKKISEFFFYFLVSILKDYNEYLFNTEKEIIIINDLFLKEDIKKINLEQLFIASQYIKKAIDKNDDPHFFTSFFKTDLFRNFLFRKYENLDKDKYDFLLFDETIVKKKNKNEILRVKSTNFINSKYFATKNDYFCEEASNFTIEELVIINSKKEQLINYYQKLDGKKISYYIFPKLLYDEKFFERKRDYEPSFDDEQLRDLFSKYKKIENELNNKDLLKVYEGDLVVRYNFDKNQFVIKNEMRNNVGYLWLSMFCFTFYYCDEEDKKYRFQELFDNLKKMESILLSQRKIMYYIFMTLINYGTDSMIIKFYDYLNFLKLNNYDFYNMFCNRMLLKKNEEEKVKNNLILKNTVLGNTEISFNYYKDKNEDELEIKNSLKKSEKNKKSLYVSKRTFHSKDDKNNAEIKEKTNEENKNKEQIEEIEFSSVKCPFCQEELNFVKLLESNKSKRRELKCNNCKKLFIPKCKVRIGNFSTTFKILHPYSLYNEFALKYMKKFGTKIDLDLLKDDYSEYYWGCILYFSFCGYSFDMMIKYSK